MQPLLEVRNALDVRDSGGARSDFHLRDFRRMNGSLTLFHRAPATEGEERTETLVHGPYRQEAREDWLRRLLRAQAEVRGHGPEEVAELELISDAELAEIRRIWVIDKHEFEDNLPRIYEECTGEAYRGPPLDEQLPLGTAEVELLAEICAEDRIHFELVRELLDIERRQRAKLRRAGLFGDLEKAIRRGSYESEEEALDRAVDRRERLAAATPTPLDDYIQRVDAAVR